ncbi:MAG TPA: hypothetical protein VMJ34_18555 [Bryobacteraceae bacterium]|nr:hypothetical protein [Bryobacteraceae bacterium]
MGLGLVAVAFAVAGVLSELLMGTAITKTFLGAAPAVLPFAILAAVLCTRPLYLAPVTMCLHCAVWTGALWLAIALDSRVPQLNLCIAGMAGGLGVAVAGMLGCRKLMRARTVLWLGAVGAVAAVPFQIPIFTQGPDSYMIWPFAIWQAAVGTLLYARSGR